jgi:hypothetical protein
MRRLTPKQEQFVQALISGMNQAEAYMYAYPTSKNWKKNTAKAKACETLKIPHVRARYEELKKEYDKHAKDQMFYDRDRLISDFMYLKDEAQESIKNIGVKQANSNAYLGALKNIGELLNLYPDKKVDINASISSDFEINIIGDEPEQDLLEDSYDDNVIECDDFFVEGDDEDAKDKYR